MFAQLVTAQSTVRSRHEGGFHWELSTGFSSHSSPSSPSTEVPSVPKQMDPVVRSGSCGKTSSHALLHYRNTAYIYTQAYAVMQTCIKVQHCTTGTTHPLITPICSRLFSPSKSKTSSAALAHPSIIQHVNKVVLQLEISQSGNSFWSQYLICQRRSDSATVSPRREVGLTHQAFKERRFISCVTPTLWRETTILKYTYKIHTKNTNLPFLCATQQMQLCNWQMQSGPMVPQLCRCS